MPSSKRPFERTSIVAACFASVIGSVMIRGTTATPRRTRSVAAATKPGVIIASAHAVFAFHDGRPSSLYGYRGLNEAGRTVCECVQTDSNPRRSEVRGKPRAVARLGD